MSQADDLRRKLIRNWNEVPLGSLRAAAGQRMAAQAPFSIADREESCAGSVAKHMRTPWVVHCARAVHFTLLETPAGHLAHPCHRQQCRLHHKARLAIMTAPSRTKLRPFGYRLAAQAALALCLGLGLSACSTPSIVVSDHLRHGTQVMEATGRQGWQFNQVLSFGDYRTSPIKRGWTQGYQIQFVARFQKAKQKLSFTQQGPGGRQAEVLAVGQFENTEFDLLKGFLSYSTSYRNSFAGSIVPREGQGGSWEFVIHNPESSLPRDADTGMAQDSRGRKLLIRGVKKVEGQANWVQLDNFGFEFLLDGRAVGAVSTINSGRVWMRHDLDPELKQVVAALSTSLLVRHSLSESFDKR